MPTGSSWARLLSSDEVRRKIELDGDRTLPATPEQTRTEAPDTREAGTSARVGMTLFVSLDDVLAGLLWVPDIAAAQGRVVIAETNSGRAWHRLCTGCHRKD